MTASIPPHLIVDRDVFAGERFWTALDRLAGQQGHLAHPTMLVGETEQLTAYRLLYTRCEATVATMQIRAPA